MRLFFQWADRVCVFVPTIELAMDWDHPAKEGTLTVLFGLARFGIAWRAPTLPLHERHSFFDFDDPAHSPYSCSRCGTGTDFVTDWERDRCPVPGDPDALPF